MAAEAPRRKRSRCRCALWLALLFDALGLAGVLVGGLLETDVSDLLIYLGGVAAFFSLPWWVFWHVGNLEVPLEELRDDVGLGWRSADAWSLESWRTRRLALLARAFSAHFSLPSASASAQSQVGRLRAHFAASTISGSGGGSSSSAGSRPSRAEKKKLQQLQQRPSQIQDSGSDADLRSARLPFSLPRLLLFQRRHRSLAGYVTMPALLGCLERLSPGCPSSEKLLKWKGGWKNEAEEEPVYSSIDLPGSSHSQESGKQESSKSFLDLPDLPGSSHSQESGKQESSKSFLDLPDFPGSSHSQESGKQESSKSFFNFPNFLRSSHSKDHGKQEPSRSLFNFLCQKQTQTDE